MLSLIILERICDLGVLLKLGGIFFSNSVFNHFLFSKIIIDMFPYHKVDMLGVEHVRQICDSSQTKKLDFRQISVEVRLLFLSELSFHSSK